MNKVYIYSRSSQITTVLQFNFMGTQEYDSLLLFEIVSPEIFKIFQCLVDREY